MSGEMLPSESLTFDLDEEDVVSQHEEELTALMSNFSPEAAYESATAAFPTDNDGDDLSPEHDFDGLDYSVYENKAGLADDMKFLASMPELCDVTFLVGETREPVCAVKAVLASRSR